MTLSWQHMSVLALVAAVAVSCQTTVAQDLPVYSGVKLPNGVMKPIHQLSPGQTSQFQVPDVWAPGTQPRMNGYPYSKWGRNWFALPTEVEGYHAICSSVDEQRTFLSVYRRVEDITRPGMRESHMVKFPLEYDREHFEVPDIYLFRAQPSQVWGVELIVYTGIGPRVVTVGAKRAELVRPGQTRTGRLPEVLSMALFELDTGAGGNYQLTMDGNEKMRLYLLAEASPTAIRVVTQRSLIRGQYPAQLGVSFAARPGTGYLAMVMIKAQEADYELHFDKMAPGASPTVWQQVRDDDGEQDSDFGQITGPDTVVHKELVLEEDPANVSSAVIRYRIGGNPYDSATATFFDRDAPADKQWPDMEVYLNDHLVLKRPLDVAAPRGWHEFAVAPSLLKPGVNLISFTREAEAFDGDWDCYYVAIDLDSDYDRSYSERSGKLYKDRLRPPYIGGSTVGGHGEYMVRIRYQTK